MRTAAPPSPPRLAPAVVVKPVAPPAPKPKPAPPAEEKKEPEPKKEPVMNVIEHLRLQLANAWVLYANLKHAHWQTFGPQFRDLHLMFEDFASAVYGTIDDLAERMRMLGVDVGLVQLKDFQGAANVTSTEAGKDMRERLEEAHANALVVIKDMRAAAKAADEEGDPGSVDLFSKFVQAHERIEWFTRQALLKKDGLVG